MLSVSWLFVVLLACALAVIVGAEWPRLAQAVGIQSRERRRRARRKKEWKVVSAESDEFAASVQRDLERLPPTRERDPSR